MEETGWKGGVWGAVALILLGLSVMIGWWTGTAWLVQGAPTFPTMHFNIALLFVLLGLGSLFCFLGFRKIATFFSLLGGSFTLLIFLERLFEANWELNHLFYSPNTRFERHFPLDSCGLNTLFAFICMYVSFFFVCRKNIQTLSLLLIGIFSGLSLAVSIVAFWGYVSGMESAYTWGELSRMSFFTTIGLALSSLLFLAYATKILKEVDNKILPIWSAALIGMILFSTTMAFTKALAQQQTENIQLAIEARIKSYTNALEEKILNVTSALDRMLKRSLDVPDLPDRAWRHDASNYLHDLKGLIGIVKLSENGEVVEKKWGILAPKDEIEHDLADNWKLILEAQEPSIYVSHFSPGPHLIYVTPKKENKTSVVGIISINQLFSELIPDFQKDQTALEIAFGGKEIYQINTSDTVYKILAQQETLPILNRAWQLTFWPTTAFIQNEEGFFPLTAFLFGCVISMFVALLTYLAQKSFEESHLMAARNLARSAFLAQVSHELRTPLSGLIASVDLLEHGIQDPKQLRLLDIMRSSGQHLLTVINEVLDLAKLEAGKIPVEPSIENVNQIANEMISLLSPKAKEKGLYLHLECDVPTALIIDATRFRQILSNLIGNGIKFTKKGGVSVVITYTHLLDKGKLKIGVEDTGVGIAKEEQHHLFEKFSPVRKRGVQGTGLGLYITRAIVEMMGGSITFSSTPDVGSLFTVTLPVSQGETGP